MKFFYLLSLLVFLATSSPVYSVQPQELKALQVKAKQGDALSQVQLGSIYYNGNGVEVNKQLAAKWFLKASRAGNADAQIRLAIMYEQGEGFGKNLKKAVNLYLQAAKNGVKGGFAELRLGLFYLNGEGVDKDDDEAHFWFEKSLDKGNLHARDAYEALGGKDRWKKNSRGNGSSFGDLLAQAVFQVLLVEPAKALTDASLTINGKTKFLGFYLGDTASQVSANNLNFLIRNGQCDLSEITKKVRSKLRGINDIPTAKCSDYEAYNVGDYVVVHNIFANTLIFDRNDKLQGVIASEKRPVRYFLDLSRGQVGGYFDNGHKIVDTARKGNRRYWHIVKEGYHTKLFSTGQKSHILRTTFTTTKKRYGVEVSKDESHTDVDYYQFFGCAYKPELWDLFFKKFEINLPCSKQNL